MGYLPSPPVTEQLGVWLAETRRNSDSRIANDVCVGTE